MTIDLTVGYAYLFISTTNTYLSRYPTYAPVDLEEVFVHAYMVDQIHS